MKLFTHTTVRWPTASDCPLLNEDSIENAHVVWHGDRLTIGMRDEAGRVRNVDTIYNATWKGTGKNSTITGVSQFMVDKIGVTPDEAEVTVNIDASNPLVKGMASA